MGSFILWSGWVFSLISTVIAIVQYLEKKKLKIELNQLKINSEHNTFAATNKGIAINKNKGDINVD